MRLKKQWLLDGVFTGGVLVLAFLVNLMLEELFDTQTMIPMVFVLGVFLVSRKTTGYFWGITASLISVLAVNYAFTYPYYAFDLITPECLSSAVVMLIVAIMTGTLTTQIKAQEKTKAEAEKERMRGNLLRAVSHDLRTPLTGIYGACSTLIENYDSMTKEQHIRLLSDTCADANWLVRMVENLLSVTRVDAQGVRLTKKDTVLEELVDAVLLKFRKHYPQQQVLLEIPEEFVSIPMDAILIEQVLMNLLENAVIHAKGMTQLQLRVQLQEHRAEFFVTDNGCGIAPERLDTLFSGISDTTAPSDTGRSNMSIGLSVCATIVKAHGGEIRAKNLSTGGAQFSFTLQREVQKHGE